ncbi:MAG: hypothetical protein INR66_01155 [Gordonia polyisoprenivorans]|nr:hypothetical protein [Gordonia polyisoprenivorans]
MRRAPVVGALVIAVCVVVVAGVTLWPRIAPAPPTISVPSTMPPLVVGSSTADMTVSDLLEQRDRLVNISIVGDGTGRTLGAWVFAFAQQLGITYGRPAQIREWRFGSRQSYTSPRQAFPGTGRPVTIWNASASRNVRYFAQTAQRWMPPVRTDVVLVSNGFDDTGIGLSAQSVALMKEVAAVNPGAAVVAVIQPVRPDRRPQAPGQDDIARDMRTSLGINDLPYIDVAGRLDGPESSALFGTGRELMAPAGYLRWGEIVDEAMRSVAVRSAS